MARLIEELRKLPGVGTKSAQRLAFHVLRSPAEDAEALSVAIRELKLHLRLCSVCNNITDVDPCGYCTSAVRNQRVVCVIEEPTNIATIEKTRSYNGVYHVLHGTLSPIGGVGPEQLRIANLLTRLTPRPQPVIPNETAHPNSGPVILSEAALAAESKDLRVDSLAASSGGFLPPNSIDETTPALSAYPDEIREVIL